MQSGSNDHPEPEDLAPIPDFARVWESSPQVASSVRRPSTLPDPQTYHEVIEPQVIFELDEKQDDGSIETILVVPSGCKRCKVMKQACSRALPACARCRKAGLACVVPQEGYQKLPGPKFDKPRKEYRTKVASTASTSAQDPLAGRARIRQMASARIAASFRDSSPGSSTARRTVSTGTMAMSESPPPSVASSKRPLSPAFDPAPPGKKALTKSVAKKRKGRRSMDALPDEMDVDAQISTAGPSAGASANQHNTLQWTLVNREEKSSLGPQDARSIPSDTLIPRVWTNSLGALLKVFPELAKAPARFSWFQSETPVLLLDNYARGEWISSTGMKIDLLWDFSCHESELEPDVELGTDILTQLHSGQPVEPHPEHALDHEVELMGLQNSYLPPGIGARSPYATASAPLPTLNTQMCAPQGEPGVRQETWDPHVEEAGPTDSPMQNGRVPTVSSGQPYSYDHLSFPANPPPFHPYSAPNGSLTDHAIPQPNPEPRIPLNKSPEVETLLNSNTHSIPLLLWLSRSSGLLPHNLPPEYACLCMGLFFISDLRHTVVRHSVSPTTGFVQGRVCWSITLEWAPGGEDALFECNSPLSSDSTSDLAPAGATRDVLRPWWVDPTDTSSQADNTAPRPPRDFRMQVFSFLPLDLLGEFHPSESFPRGWFCKSCGMINIQVHFRHQLCQSTTCGATRDGLIPPGKVESLSSLRDHHQSITLTRPTTKVPSVVGSDNIAWDDGMQSWIYSIRDGVTLCHIFTGNQQDLQQDATALLESIQREVLLSKDDSTGPYFIHNTELSHSGDGSEAMVPAGTPNCVRTAYYSLCDFVHRYGEMDQPRFGEVRALAWVNPGSRKGSVLRASKSPAIIHCLGAEVVLSFAPKGGYEDAEKSSAPDKGKGRAEDEDRTISPPTEPCAGPSCHLEQDNGDRAPSIPGPEANEMPIVAENEVNVAMDTTRQRSGDDDVGIPLSNSNTCPGMEAAPQEAVQRRGRKKNKVKTKTSVSEISMTLVHGDCVILIGDDFELQIVRTGTTVLVIGLPEEA